MKATILILAVLGWLWSTIAMAAPDTGYEAFRNRNFCRVLFYLQTLYRVPGTVKNRFLIGEPMWRGDRYVQCLIAPNRSGILCELASGEWLRPPLRLVPPHRLPVLFALGFGPAPTNGNYQVSRPLAQESDLQQVAELFLRAFYDVYGLPPEADLRLKAPLVRRVPVAQPSVDRDCQPYTS